MTGLEALEAVQYVTVGNSRFAVVDVNDWESLVEWLETLEDVQAAKEALAELRAAGGDRQRRLDALGRREGGIETRRAAMPTTMNMVYWKGEQFWVGKLLDHPDIMSQGETIEELESNLREAYLLMVMDDVPDEHLIKPIAIST